MPRILPLTFSHSSIGLQSLRRDLEVYLRNSLAKSTKSTYSSGVRSYLSFCSTSHIVPFPATQDSLCLFTTYSARRPVSVKTIKVYLHGIVFQDTLLGGKIRLPSLNILFQLLRGIKRTQRNSFTRPPRKPITVNHLYLISQFLAASRYSPVDKYMFLASSLVAFFGLLRISEFACPSQSTFDPTLHLCRDNVSFNKDRTIMFLRIKGSKTDPFRE